MGSSLTTQQPTTVAEQVAGGPQEAAGLPWLDQACRAGSGLVYIETSVQSPHAGCRADGSPAEGRVLRWVSRYTDKPPLPGLF